jgi:hypothetical protein
MIKTFSPKIYLWAVMSIATFWNVACGDSSKRSACYSLLFELQRFDQILAISSRLRQKVSTT